ncbi:MAG: aminotransferase class I/II-fold pyridoxal phosphate-dependent enzyme [Candidatus Promineifilaceae bacterium]
MLTSKNNAILIDSGSYAIARWGAERAAGRGVLVESFSHHDPQALARHLQRLPAGRRPVIIADGLCSICGCTAPLRAYAALAKTTAGMLLIDDSQALGLLGASPTPWKPYGLGGGGSLAWSGIRDAHILVISSLAKAFGAPLAVLTGSAVQVEIFARQSETRMHCSPPSLADLCAAERALGLNNIRGDLLRARLLALVKRFRHRMQQVGVRMVGGLFPVQTLATLTGEKAVRTWRQLREAGVNALLRQDHRRQPRLSFIVTSAHSPDDIDAAASILIATIFRPTLADTNKL